MRLTKEMKQMFIYAVMNDVPAVNYVQQIEDAVLKEYVEQLPPAVRRVWDDTKLRGYVNTGTVHARFFDTPDYTPGEPGFGYHQSVRVPMFDTTQRQYISTESVRRLVLAQIEQRALRKELEQKLTNATAGCTTVKQLHERLPEFEKYLPKGAVVDRTVPAIAGVVDAFKKAGWPTDKK